MLKRLLTAVLCLCLLCPAVSAAGKVEYQGKVYKPRARVTSVLLIGVDKLSTDKAEGLYRYRMGGQADFLLLLIIDDDDKTICPLFINRDTITPITTLTVMGDVFRKQDQQICLSHGFGDGGEQSCLYTAEAVSDLLYGINVDHYAALFRDGLTVMNDSVGGVTVTVEDDMTNIDPLFVKGSTVHLTGASAERFVRARMSVGDGSNVSRMRRQKTYLKALFPILESKIRANANYIGRLFDELDAALVTDMTRGRMVNMANKARNYEVLDMIELPGTLTQDSDGYAAFIPDKNGLYEIVLEHFYKVSR